ncbi:MAG: translation initiation factor IF-2 [Bacteroidales bacterium]|nr:translation initiation factor IF-2 [Bacteroidales bacterium]
MEKTEKAIRLSKVAREFNVGISTIIDFLKKKGHPVENNPNTKVSDELYEILVQEFSNDLTVKKESEKVDLKKLKEKQESISINDIDLEEDEDILEKEEDDELMIKDLSVSKEKISDTESKKVPEIKVIDKIDLSKLNKKYKEEDTINEKLEEVISSENGDIDKLEEIEEKTKDKYFDHKENLPEPEVKVVGKIDLDSINQLTRPPKKTKEEKEKERKERLEKLEQERKAKSEIISQSDEVDIDSKIESKEESVVESLDLKIDKISGPTVVGKISIPAKKEDIDSEFDKSERKKKRKRIRKDGQPVYVKEEKQKKDEEESKFIRDKKKKKKPFRHEVSEEDVQKQIKETLARLTTKGKSKGSKYRREKRDAIHLREQEKEAIKEKEKNVLKVTEFVSVNELAKMMDVPVTDIISTCMSLGLFVSINQRLDAETMALVAEEFNYKVEFVSVEIQESIKEEKDQPQDLIPRPPIVTVMGHVDHGKTKLLDYIRSANVVAGEAGGITQHIGAYSVEMEDGRHITFLDTPGHEAFTAMRARGAQVTDVAVIVVAADDGVMPQTVEAINHAHAAGTPIVFAINKIDKPTSNPDKIKEELAKMNFLVEDWGGKYQSQEISAKNGINIYELLDKVLLEAELLELKANPNKKASGTIIESSLDKGRGYVATVLVQNGTLKVGDIILSGVNSGRIKAMYNERGKKINEVGPSTPVLILGLDGAPQAGEKFNILESEREAKEIANKREQLQREQDIRTHKHITLDEIGRRIAIGNFQELNIIVKGDVDGSVEALSDSLIKLSTEQIQVNVIHKAVGQISETDIMLAMASNAIVVGFQVRPSMGARKLAEKEEIDIRLYSIIYDAINEIKDAMEGMLSPEVKEEIKGTVEIKEIFKISKVGTIAGCLVREGKINRNSQVRLIRDGIVVYSGELGSLKRFKEDVKEVINGYECGLNIANFNDMKVGDIIEAYEEVEVKQKL